MIFQKRKWKFGWLRVLVWPVRLIKSPCFQMGAPNLGVHLWSCQRKGVWPFSQWSYVFWCKQKQFPRTNSVFLNSSAVAPCQFLPALGAPDTCESVLQWHPALRWCSNGAQGTCPAASSPLGARGRPAFPTLNPCACLARPLLQLILSSFSSPSTQRSGVPTPAFTFPFSLRAQLTWMFSGLVPSDSTPWVES